MSNITRRTVLAGVPAIAVTVPAATPAPLTDLRPSDPAIAARWAELVPYMVETDAIAYRGGMTCEEEKAESRRRDQLCQSVYEFAKTVWAAPVRSFGDVVIRAALARYVASEDPYGGKIHELEEDGYPESFERSAAHVVLAVFNLAGLPTEGLGSPSLQAPLRWEAAPMSSNPIDKTFTVGELEDALCNVDDAAILLEYVRHDTEPGTTHHPTVVATDLLLTRIRELKAFIMGTPDANDAIEETQPAV